MKGAIRFQQKGKHSPRHVGPFKIKSHIGNLAYMLNLPAEFTSLYYLSMFEIPLTSFSMMKFKTNLTQHTLSVRSVLLTRKNKCYKREPHVGSNFFGIIINQKKPRGSSMNKWHDTILNALLRYVHSEDQMIPRGGEMQHPDPN